MDEPFGALDPQIREMMQIELMKLWDQMPCAAESPSPPPHAGEGVTPRRKTVLFVTHSVDEAVFLSDRVILFGTQPGRVIADLTIELPRPRWSDDEALKRSAAFIAYRNDIWHLLKQQLATFDGAGA
jgi:NitT/TauT family transport system ATP-binding protein